MHPIMTVWWWEITVRLWRLHLGAKILWHGCYVITYTSSNVLFLGESTACAPFARTTFFRGLTIRLVSFYVFQFLCPQFRKYTSKIIFHREVDIWSSFLLIFIKIYFCVACTLSMCTPHFFFFVMTAMTWTMSGVIFFNFYIFLASQGTGY